MSSADLTIKAFISALSSASPSPGGGGAAALAASLSSSLVSMAISATAENIRYIDYRDQLLSEAAALAEITGELLELIDKDAECFEPMSRLYKLPKNHPEYHSIKQQAAITACSAPLEILACIQKICVIIENNYRKISRSILSDVNSASYLCVAAARCAADTIAANTRMLQGSADSDRIENARDNILAEIYSVTGIIDNKTDPSISPEVS